MKNSYYILIVIALLSVGTGCATPHRSGTSGSQSSISGRATLNETPEEVLTGKASWYGHPFHGRKTANGEKYNMYAYTAAHKSLPFGSRLLVVNLQNNRSLMVRVNDRGPYIGGRILDLSYAAAKDLGMVGSGVTSVWVGVYPPNEEKIVASAGWKKNKPDFYSLLK